MRIAMWSGPRNLSTAMMYSFGARDDCAIWDEPFYAAYLEETGLQHPMQDEIISQGVLNPDEVVQRCLGDIPDSKSVFYQKHMTHHILPEFDQNWINQMTNVFLIRHPARVISSYQLKRENPTLKDIGFEQQTMIFDKVYKAQSNVPVVIDSADIRRAPKLMLRKLCSAINLPFQSSMLRWPKGGHKDDGAWAPHWYQSVWESTGFAKPEGALPEIDNVLQPVLEQALPHYEKLARYKLRMQS